MSPRPPQGAGWAGPATPSPDSGVQPRPRAPTGPGTAYPPQYLPGFNFQPEGSLGIDIENELDIVPGSTVALLAMVVPPTYKARLSGIGFAADDEVALRFLDWVLLIGGDPERRYATNLAVTGTLDDMSPLAVPVGGGQSVTLRVTQNLAAIVTYHIGARLIGWMYRETGA